MGRQGIKLDKAHAFSSRFLQLCAQEEKALSQWGAIFHTTRQTISNWQTGESVPDIIKLMDIAQYFGVSTDYLLGRHYKQEYLFHQNQKRLSNQQRHPSHE